MGSTVSTSSERSHVLVFKVTNVDESGRKCFKAKIGLVEQNIKLFKVNRKLKKINNFGLDSLLVLQM